MLSGRRRRACALASVRRSNCTDGFPVCSFHEDISSGDVNQGQLLRGPFVTPLRLIRAASILGR